MKKLIRFLTFWIPVKKWRKKCRNLLSQLTLEYLTVFIRLIGKVKCQCSVIAGGLNSAKRNPRSECSEPGRADKKRWCLLFVRDDIVVPNEFGGQMSGVSLDFVFDFKSNIRVVS